MHVYYPMTTVLTYTRRKLTSQEAKSISIGYSYKLKTLYQSTYHAMSTSFEHEIYEGYNWYVTSWGDDGSRVLTWQV